MEHWWVWLLAGAALALFFAWADGDLACSCQGDDSTPAAPSCPQAYT